MTDPHSNARRTVATRTISTARALGVLLLASWVAVAHAAPEVQLRLDSRQVYAGLPFGLVMEATGFAEDPQPAEPALAIPGAKVTYLGVNPNVSQQISFINGRRSESRSVTFAYRWRVEVPRAGTYTVPALEITQGALRASTQPARLQAGEIEVSSDMQLRLKLPDRPVWIGETFTAEIEWLLTKDVQEFDFVVPLFEDDAVRVAAPASVGRTINFNAGVKTLALPLQQDQITEAGVRYGRFRFPVEITAQRAGPLDVAPIRVVAQLSAGAYRDRFGFRRTRTDLYQATSAQETLVVRALPLADRPASFVNAIGSGFGIDVTAERTVVQVGDPVELEISVRGDASLAGLSLPSLEAAGLPAALFGVAAAPDVGEATAGGKTFRAIVRVLSAEVREIPALAFGYFDPARGTYEVARSRPIALSVSGAERVGAEQVASAAPQPQARALPAPGPTRTPGQSTLIGADMALSAAAQTLRSSWRARWWLPLLALLYAVPLVAAALILWWRGTHAARRERGRTAGARRRAAAAIASREPLRTAAPEILAALREFASVTEQPELLRAPVVSRLETVAYDPQAEQTPLAEEDRRALEGLLAPNPTSAPPAVASAPLIGLLCGLLLGLAATSEPAGAAEPDAFNAARQLYKQALATTDRVQRVARFDAAERALASLAARHPQAAELQADWGNAALGAQRHGAATLAFRRALHLDPGNARARANLQWLRDRAPAWLPAIDADGAFATLLFWQRTLTPADRYLLGALGFALMLTLLLLRRPALARLAIAPGLLWLACTASAVFDDHDADHAVVILDGALLRSADSIGAAAAFAEPLPAGAEVIVLERRDGWRRVALGDGSRGWLQRASLADVIPRD
ncbi:MAG: BatD family protein [Pseudomonadota bacterium]